ncbi:MAG: transposase [Planctomycetes bacterium]|nr:transposase [Planctomycetota bacterium]
MTQCSTDAIKFKILGMRFVVADFNGGTITSDAGVVLLDKTEQAIALLGRAAECFADHRDGDHGLLRSQRRGLRVGQAGEEFSSGGRDCRRVEHR